jgi:hypothetical protein
MPKPPTISFPQIYATAASDLMTRLGDSIAIQAGPPTSEPLVPATEELQVKAWNERNPAATDEAMQQLAIQKYQEHIGSGMPPDVAQRATAEDLTHFRYGQRLKLYTYGQTDFAEQIAEAKRLAKLAARETTPNPPLPPPTMPSAALTNLTGMGAPLPPAGLPTTLPSPGGLDVTTEAAAPAEAPTLPTTAVSSPTGGGGMVERPRDSY